MHLELKKNICLFGGLDQIVLMNMIVKYLNSHNEFMFVIKGYMQPLNEKRIYNELGTYLIKAGLTKTINSVLLKEQLKEYETLLASTPENFRLYIVFYELSNYGFLDP